VMTARGPPQWEADESSTVFLYEVGSSGNPQPKPEAEYDFDQLSTRRGPIAAVRLDLEAPEKLPCKGYRAARPLGIGS
jgi:hypothetical protein